MSRTLHDARATYEEAATAFLALVDPIPLPAYGGPGLGTWDLRSLIGHTGRALTTVATNLTTRADAVAAADAADYFALVSRHDHGVVRDAVHQRGIEAGVALGEDPMDRLREAYADALAAIDLLEGEDPVVETTAGGMRASDYLPTRTFELVVHSFDIARATHRDFTAPTEALADALALASASALRLGHGTDVLLALTGRQPLPEGSSVVI